MKSLTSCVDKIIKWSRFKLDHYGHKLQIDLVYLVKNEFWVHSRQALTLITGLAVSVAFARLASKETYGQYNLILAILALFSLFSLPGLNTAVMQSVARGYEGSYKPAVKKSFLWSLLGVPIILGTGVYYYYYNNQIIGICLMMSSIFFPFLNAPNTWDAFLQGKKRFDLSAKYGSFQAILNAAALTIIIFSNPDNLVLIFAIYLISNTILNCLLFLKSLSLIENDVQDKDCLRYGYFITTTNIVGTIAKNIDKILIATLLGAPQLAIYVIAIMIPTKITETLKLTLSPLTPKFCQDENQMSTILEKIGRVSMPIILMIFGIGLMYYLFIDDVILLLFGENYTNAIVYSKILLPMILISIPNVFLGTFAIAKKNQTAIIAGYHIFPFIKLFIMSSFIYLWGIMGAVWGLNLSVAVQMMLIGAGILKEHRMSS